LLIVFRERLGFVNSRRKAGLQNAFFQKLLGSALLTFWLSHLSTLACPKHTSKRALAPLRSRSRAQRRAILTNSLAVNIEETTCV
jgi:hypothetical protein